MNADQDCIPKTPSNPPSPAGSLIIDEKSQKLPSPINRGESPGTETESIHSEKPVRLEIYF